MDASLFTSMLFATVVAGTPLIIVALGLLVSEKAGVLNLGAEGMMAMGAVAAFAVTHESGNPWLGVAAGLGAGMAMAALFGILTLTLMANQVASGLALAIFGVGLAAFVGKPYEAVALQAVPPIRIPFIADLPLIGEALYNQQALVYFSWALFWGLLWFLHRSRAGLVLRAVPALLTLMLVAGQTLFERGLGMQSTLSVVIEFAGGLFFLWLLLKGRMR